MKRLSLLAVAAGLTIAAPIAIAQSSPSTTKAKTSESRQELHSKAKGLALATETTQKISQNQLDIAGRVLTGKADCEFNQSVDVSPIAGKPGFFKVGYKGSSYTMVPEETSTGAVRLEDKKAGVVWLQIPSKSMLMNSKAGQRMVDSCMHSEQRAAVNAVNAAGRSTQ